MQNNVKQIPNVGEDVLSLVEDLLNLVAATVAEEGVCEEVVCGDLIVKEEEEEEEEECGNSSPEQTSVCDGYEADNDNEDNETVICGNDLDCDDIDDDGYHSNPKPLDFGAKDVNNNTNSDKNFNDNSVNDKSVKKWIAIGNTVLSRWTDGLFYLGLIVQVRTSPPPTVCPLFLCVFMSYESLMSYLLSNELFDVLANDYIKCLFHMPLKYNTFPINDIILSLFVIFSDLKIFYLKNTFIETISQTFEVFL
jgi:hypothetical protein